MPATADHLSGVTLLLLLSAVVGSAVSSDSTLQVTGVITYDDNSKNNAGDVVNLFKFSELSENESPTSSESTQQLVPHVRRKLTARRREIKKPRISSQDEQIQQPQEAPHPQHCECTQLARRFPALSQYLRPPTHQREPVVYTLIAEHDISTFSGDPHQVIPWQIPLNPRFYELVMKSVESGRDKDTFVRCAMQYEVVLPYYLFFDWASPSTLERLASVLTSVLTESDKLAAVSRITAKFLVYQPGYLESLKEDIDHGLPHEVAVVALTPEDAAYAALYGLKHTLSAYINFVMSTEEEEGREPGLPFGVIHTNIYPMECLQNNAASIPAANVLQTHSLQGSCWGVKTVFQIQHGNLLTSFLENGLESSADFVWGFLSLEQKMHLFYLYDFPQHQEYISKRYGGPLLLFLDLFSSPHYERKDEALVDRFFSAIKSVAMAAMRDPQMYIADMARVFEGFIEFAITDSIQAANRREEAIGGWLDSTMDSALTLSEFEGSLQVTLQTFIARARALMLSLKRSSMPLFHQGNVFFCSSDNSGSDNSAPIAGAENHISAPSLLMLQHDNFVSSGRTFTYHFVPQLLVFRLFGSSDMAMSILQWADAHKNDNAAAASFYKTFFFNQLSIPCSTPQPLPIKFSPDLDFLSNRRMVERILQWSAEFLPSKEKELRSKICSGMKEASDRSPRDLLTEKYRSFLDYLRCL